MDFKDIVRKGFDEFLDELKKAVDNLSLEERRFQPSPDSHHIDFAVWHMARVEDQWVQRFARQEPTVWERDGWHTRLGMPQRDIGFGYTAEEVRNLEQFDMSDMLDYYDSVRIETYKFLDSLSESDLSTEPHPKRPGYSIAQMFSHVMIEEAQHVGQVAYLRGLQRGLNR